MSGFELFLTEKGFRLIDNPILMSIADALDDGEKTFTEIMEYTKHPRSTISVYLKKLESNGLVVAHDPDARKTHKTYSLNGVNFIKSAKIPGSYEVDFDLLEYDTNDLFDKYFYWFLHVSTSRNCITIMPKNLHSLRNIGAFGCKYHNCMKFQDAISNISDMFSKWGMADLELVSELPIVFKLKLSFNVPSIIGTEIMKALASFVSGYLESIPGFGIGLETGEVSDYEESGTFRLDMMPAKMEYFDIPSDTRCGFSILWASGTYVAVTKELDNRIIDMLAEGDIGMKHLAKSLGKPISTVSDAVTRLTDLNITAYKRVNGSDVVTLTAAKVFGDGADLDGVEQMADYYLKKIWDDPEHLLLHIRRYEYHRMRAYGFDITNLMKVAATDFADQICRSHPDLDTECVLELLSRNGAKWFSADISVNSLHPLDISLVKTLDQAEAEIDMTKKLFTAFFTRLMINVTGIPYILSDERSFINGTALRLVFTVDGGGNF